MVFHLDGLLVEVEVDTSHLVEVLLTEQIILLVVTMAVVVVVDLLVIPYMEKML
tara:strand:- start:51 stop:212 length:162 start_codon:yes stop_codon:yes gene_type:complete